MSNLLEIVKVLKEMVNTDPQINAQNMGECIYCGAALDEGNPHADGCHYLKATKLIREFEDIWMTK